MRETSTKYYTTFVLVSFPTTSRTIKNLGKSIVWKTKSLDDKTIDYLYLVRHFSG